MVTWIKSLFSSCSKSKPQAVAVSMVGPKICIVDYCGLPVDKLKAYADAQMIQCNRDFSPPPPKGWGMGVQSVRVCDAATPPQPDEWVMALLPTATLANALGFHDITPYGLPVIKCFPLLDPNQPWSVTCSHEVLEALVDPELRLAFQDDQGRFWAGEVADSCEEDKYLINGVWMSDFVTPVYFQPPANLSGLKLDYMNLIKQPFEIRVGSYAQVWFDNQGWLQLGPGESPPARKAWKELRGEHSRAVRRQAKFLAAKKAK